MVGILSQCMCLSNCHFKSYNFICQLYTSKKYEQTPWKKVRPSKMIAETGPFPVPTFLLLLGHSYSIFWNPVFTDVVSFLISHILLSILVICVPFLCIRQKSLRCCEVVKWGRFQSIPARSLTLVFCCVFFTLGRKQWCCSPHRKQLCLTWGRSWGVCCTHECHSAQCVFMGVHG